jgi:hydroquinone glucosyltransferase
MSNKTKNPHVAIVCSPGLGHLLPCVQLADRLATVHNMSITLLINPKNTSSPAYVSLFEKLPANVAAITLSNPLSPDLFPRNTDSLSRIILTTKLNLPQIQSHLKDLQSTGSLLAVVIDIFAFMATEAALQLGIPCYRFIPCSCLTLSVFLHVPELDKSFPGNLRDVEEPIRLPGCVPITGPDFLEPIQTRSDGAYALLIQHGKDLLDMKGILVNSFEELEPKVVKAYKDSKEGWPPIYAVGPLIRPIEHELDQVQENETVSWLDLQPDTSVVYVSFGSWCTLKPQQLTELAFGLEESGHRFIWVVKESVNGSLADVLPEGVLERTKEISRIITTWAPQVSILKHKSIAAFVTHCGWGSSLEGIINGVPLIAFPMFAEQKMNAVLLTEEVKVALRLRGSESGLVLRDEISRVVKCVMEEQEGKQLRDRAVALKDAAAGALLEGGSSHCALEEVVEVWKKNVI